MVVKIEHFQRSVTEDPEYQALHAHLTALCGNTRTWESPWVYQNIGTGHKCAEVGGWPLLFARSLPEKFQHVSATDNFSWAFRCDLQGNQPSPEEWFKQLWPGVFGHLADLKCLPWRDQELDAIAAVSVIEHLMNPTRGLKEMCRVARRVVFTTDVSPEGSPYRGYDRVFSPAGLKLLLADVGAEVEIPPLPPQDAWMYPDLGFNVCGVCIEQ